jgi:hypothetical protein
MTDAWFVWKLKQRVVNESSFLRISIETIYAIENSSNTAQSCLAFSCIRVIFRLQHSSQISVWLNSQCVIVSCVWFPWRFPISRSFVNKSPWYWVSAKENYSTSMKCFIKIDLYKITSTPNFYFNQFTNSLYNLGIFTILLWKSKYNKNRT